MSAVDVVELARVQATLGEIRATVDAFRDAWVPLDVGAEPDPAELAAYAEGLQASLEALLLWLRVAAAAPTIDRRRQAAGLRDRIAGDARDTLAQIVDRRGDV